jgi:uncharacterized protein
MSSQPNETALITGASSGIGLELAHLFAANRSNLVLVARSREKLDSLADELRRLHGGDVLVLPKDLSDSAAPSEILAELTAWRVDVDVLVNNAGFGEIGPVATVAPKTMMDMIQVNVASLAHLTRLFLPGMLGRRRGGILNVGSTAAFQPGPNMAVYYATKAFVLSFTEALAEELVGSGVTATCLSPGPTATQFGAVSGMEHCLAFKLGMMDARKVAELGYRGFRQGKPLVITGLKNKLGAFSVRFLPRILVRKAVKRLQT